MSEQFTDLKLEEAMEMIRGVFNQQIQKREQLIEKLKSKDAHIIHLKKKLMAELLNK